MKTYYTIELKNKPGFYIKEIPLTKTFLALVDDLVFTERKETSWRGTILIQDATEESVHINPEFITDDLKQAKVLVQQYKYAHEISTSCNDFFKFNNQLKNVNSYDFARKICNQLDSIKVDGDKLTIPEKLKAKPREAFIKFNKPKLYKVQTGNFDTDYFNDITPGARRPMCSVCGAILIDTPFLHVDKHFVCCLCLKEALSKIEPLIDYDWLKTIQKERFLHQI